MQTKLRIALFATVALVTPLHAQKAQRAQSNASGLITDATTGSPVRGALIEFPGLRRMALTDSNGRFTVTGLNTGRQKMVVNHMGYRTVVREVEVGQSESVNVPLDPDPVMLKGIEVQVDRIAARRKGVSASIALYERSRILGTPAFSAADFVRSNLGLFPCGRSGRESCLLHRGSAIQPVVYIDERRAFGLMELESYPTQDIFLVESYDGGRMIRVYTTWFMQQLVRTNQPMQQIVIW